MRTSGVQPDSWGCGLALDTDGLRCSITVHSARTVAPERERRGTMRGGVGGWDPPGEEWPLLFRHSGLVKGPGFEARVTIQGRLLATINPADGSCYLDGVYPGSIAVQGTDLHDAQVALRRAISEIHEDISYSSEDFDAFKSHLQDFLRTTDEETIGSWEDALEKVRSGSAGAPDMKKYDAAEWPTGGRVEIEGSEYIPAIPAPDEDVLLAA